MIKKSPNKTFIPFELIFFDKIKTEAPPTPRIKPMILFHVKRSFRIQAAMTVMIMGVVSIKREACMVCVMDNPLIKKSWLMVTPKMEHQKNRE